MKKRCAKDRTQMQPNCIILGFCETPPLQVSSRIRQCALVFWRFQWTKFSARLIHVFLKVFAFWGAKLGVVSAQFKSEWYVGVSCYPFEIPISTNKANEGYVVREQPPRMTANVDVRNECIRFFWVYATPAHD